jgi:PST family polysaccharide transporter
MFAIEIANYILPFLVIPYIVQVVGVEKFGLITFSYVFIAYFNLIIDYGFKLIIVKDISLFRNSTKKLSYLFSKMYISQLFLFTISSILFLLIIQFKPFSENSEIFIFAYLMVIGNMLFPIWFFQGIEHMKYIAIFDFISRIGYLLAVFYFINEQDDYIYVPLLNALSFIIAGIFSLIFIFYKYKIKFIFVKLSQLKTFFQNSWHLFISSITVNLYSNLNILLLGFFAGYGAVGVYSLADKIFGAIIKTIGVINIVLFPKLSLLSNNKPQLLKRFRQLIKYHIFGLFIIGTMLFLLANFIISLLFGEGHTISVVILKIMSLILLFRPFGQIFTNYLVINKKNKLISKITLQTMLFNIVIALPLIFIYQEIGLAFAVLLVQIFQVYLMIHKTNIIKGLNNETR